MSKLAEWQVTKAELNKKKTSPRGISLPEHLHVQNLLRCITSKRGEEGRGDTDLYPRLRYAEQTQPSNTHPWQVCCMSHIGLLLFRSQTRWKNMTSLCFPFQLFPALLTSRKVRVTGGGGVRRFPQLKSIYLPFLTILLQARSYREFRHTWMMLFDWQPFTEAPRCETYVTLKSDASIQSM